MKSFKEQYTLAKRQEMYNKAVQQHPKKIAVVVQAHPRSKLAINKYFKFMANEAYTASSIQENIRKQLIRTNQIPKNDTTAIYLFCKNKLLKASDFLKDLEKDRDPEDNFLYLMVAETFMLDDDANIIGSVSDLFEGHDAVYGRSARNIVLFSCSRLHSLLPAPDIEEFRPVCLQIQLNLAPFEDMDAWKHFGRLSDHDIEFTALFFQLGSIKSIRLRLLLREELIAQRAKVVVIGMIDETGVFLVETLHYTLLGAGLIFMQTFLRVCLIKVIRPATPTVDPAKEPIPFEQSIISGEASKIN